MLSYQCFGFRPFGIEKKVNYLLQFLEVTDSFEETSCFLTDSTKNSPRYFTCSYISTRCKRRNINFVGHAIYISNKTNRYTFHSRSKVRRQSFSDRKWKSQNVSRNTTTPTWMNFELWTTRWLLNGFLSHEMFNLRFWSSNAFEAEVLKWYSSQYKLTKFCLLILVRKIHVFVKINSYPAYSTRTRVFHTPYPGTPAPRFPPTRP